MSPREIESHTPGTTANRWQRWDQSPFTHRSIYSLPRSQCTMKNGWQRPVSAPSNFQCEKGIVRVSTHTKIFSSSPPNMGRQAKSLWGIYINMQQTMPPGTRMTSPPPQHEAQAIKTVKQESKQSRDAGYVHSWEPMDESHSSASLFHSGQDLN